MRCSYVGTGDLDMASNPRRYTSDKLAKAVFVLVTSDASLPERLKIACGIIYHLKLQTNVPSDIDKLIKELEEKMSVDISTGEAIVLAERILDMSYQWPE